MRISKSTKTSVKASCASNNKPLTKEEVKKLWDKKALFIDFGDSDAMCQDNGYTLDQTLKYMDQGYKVYIDECTSSVKASKKSIKASDNYNYDLKSMSDDQLRELLTNVIDEREGYDEDDMSERATYLDDLYLDIDNELASRKSIKSCSSSTSTDKALQHIKAAIDILGKSGKKDAVTKDSIANLGVVMFDLKAKK